MSFHLSKAFRPKNIAPGATKSHAALYTLGLSDVAEINPGGKNDALFGGANKAQTAQAQKDEQAAQDIQTGRTNDLLQRADASYGVGLSPEARANSSRLTARRTALTNDALTTAKGAADTNYGQDLSEQRASLARAGLTGSGMEAQGRSDLLARYFGQIQGAQQGAQQAGARFDTGNTQARLGLRTGIRGGQITDTSGLSTEIAGLTAQGSNPALWSNIIGQGAQSGATAYSNRKLAAAYSGGSGGGAMA